MDVDHTKNLKRKRSQTPQPNGTAKSLQDLQQLLDVSLLVNGDDISRRFDEIAAALLHEFSLSLTGGGKVTELEVLELEFYLQKTGCHEDPFTHGSEEQRRSGQWYFHRTPRRSANTQHGPTATGGFKDGTRKGLDLTFGGPVTVDSPYASNEEASILRGGILLRTLRRMSDSKIISGPSLLVDEILRLSGGGSLTDLVYQTWGGDISAFPPASPSRPTSLHLRLKTRPLIQAARPPVYRSPRIGLDLFQAGPESTAEHPRVVYLAKPFRYFVFPKLLTANGRSQTFLGVYRACLDSEQHAGSSLRLALTRLTGLSEAVVVRYLADYRSGGESGQLRSFLGTAGKGAAGSPKTYLRMMGTVDKLRGTYEA